MKVDLLRCKAGDMYIGALHRKGALIAERYNIPVKILSAKYGWLEPEQVIETYDTKFKHNYDGDWMGPETYGYYVGGSLYFANAPVPRFQRLVPKTGIGTMLGNLTKMINNPVQTRLELMTHPCHKEGFFL